MFGWIRKYLPSSRKSNATTGMTKRSRWGSADTDRLTDWGKATGQDINRDLAESGDTLRIRSTYEAANNPYVEGVIKTFADDVVGKDGPKLQVGSPNATYNEALEIVWREIVWPDLDVAGVLSGTEMLRLDLNQMWPDGEFLNHITLRDDDEFNWPRLQAIYSKRLKTAHDNLGDGEWTLGVRRDRLGKPLEYSIEDIPENQSLSPYTFEFKKLPAEDVIHGFDVVEPGQARGFPWLACCLQSISNARDYTKAVVESARSWAKITAVMTAQGDEVETAVVNEETSVEHGMIMALPPGNMIEQLRAEQPVATFVEFTSEMHREIGRPINMPLMLVKLDASDHNYSSARFDGQNYGRTVAYRQSWLERIKLNRLVKRVAKQATILANTPKLAGILEPRHIQALKHPPVSTSVKYLWSWPVRPHVDPFKESMGEKVALENGTLDPYAAAAARGEDYDEVLARKARAIKSHEANGVPLPAHLLGESDTADSLSSAIQNAEKDADEADKKGDTKEADEAREFADGLRASMAPVRNGLSKEVVHS